MTENEAIQAVIGLLHEHSQEAHDSILIDNPDIERLRTAAAGHVYASVALKDNCNPDQAINALVCIVEMAYILGYNAGKQAAEIAEAWGLGKKAKGEPGEG